MPCLSTFLTEHPALDIDVVLDDRDIDLIAAGIDVGLLIGRLADSAVIARKIGQCQRRVIGAPAYFDARGVPQTPADLLAHQAIIYEQRDGNPFRQGTSKTSVTLRAVFPTGRQASAKARPLRALSKSKSRSADSAPPRRDERRE